MDTNITDSTKVSQPLKSYTVEVVRTSYAVRLIPVKALNIRDAKRKALDEAGNYLYNEHGAEYSVETIVEDRIN